MGDQDKIIWNFHGSWFLKSCGISWAKALLYLEFPTVQGQSEKPRNSSAVVLSSTTLMDFSGIAQCFYSETEATIQLDE